MDKTVSSKSKTVDCPECLTPKEKMEDYNDNPDSQNTKWYCPTCKAGTL